MEKITGIKKAVGDFNRMSGDLEIRFYSNAGKVVCMEKVEILNGTNEYQVIFKKRGLDNTKLTMDAVLSKVAYKKERMRTDFSYEVIEDNGGGLTLAVFKNNKIIFCHSGYEYCKGQLSEDLKSLKEGEDPRDWEGCEENMREFYKDLTSYECGWEIIADETKIYPNDMGAAGRLEFGIED